MSSPFSTHALPRHRFAHLPTPLDELSGLTRALGGPRILIKRDDQTGLALGGNKARKLEFLLADAERQGATTLITAGAAQSNHCRQTAAAAALGGLRCILVLGGEPPATPNGNLLLDLLLGAEIHWTGRDRRGERMEEIAGEVRGRGERPYVIPYGGSNGIGALGYMAAAAELQEQLEGSGIEDPAMILASSSGGTQAGLVAGAAVCGLRARIMGISIDKGEREEVAYEEEMAAIANASLERAGWETRVQPSAFTVKYGSLGGGYGVVGDPEREAISLVARTDGILLDPVYTGRAMGALIAMIRDGEFSAAETIIFWHTGGSVALFSYASDLL